MKTFDNKKIVLKVEDDMNPEDIYCTTYQMRNFYRQFADGFFSSLDVMNYIQHHKAVLMMKSGDKVLDACFGLDGIRRLYSYFHLPETKPTFLPSFLEDLRINEHLLQHLAREEGP